MMNPIQFKAGQVVEARSFIKGYRGAWFRCKIHDTRIRRGFLECYLEYSDFPDEKIKWTNIYEVPPKGSGASSNQKQSNRELLLRPSFPPFHKESELPPQHSPAEVRAVVNDAWKVGDLVDLWCDGCFWSGKIIKLCAVDTVEVELPGAPVGEGNSYKGALKDLRPSLSWSLEKGWSVPISQVNGETWCTAWLVQQPLKRSLNNSEQSTSAADKASDPDWRILNSRKEATATFSTSFKNPNHSSMCFARSKYDQTKPIATPDLTITSSRSQSSQQNSSDRKSLQEQPGMLGESIMELEEVATKIKWLKGLLQYGPAYFNDMRPSWKFLPGSKQ